MTNKVALKILKTEKDKLMSEPECNRDWELITALDIAIESLKIYTGKDGEVRSPIGHKHEIIRMLRKDTECPYSACAKAYEKALNYLRDGGEVE